MQSPKKQDMKAPNAEEPPLDIKTEGPSEDPRRPPILHLYSLCRASLRQCSWKPKKYKKIFCIKSAALEGVRVLPRLRFHRHQTLVSLQSIQFISLSHVARGGTLRAAQVNTGLFACQPECKSKWLYARFLFELYIFKTTKHDAFFCPETDSGFCFSVGVH